MFGGPAILRCKKCKKVLAIGEAGLVCQSLDCGGIKPCDTITDLCKEHPELVVEHDVRTEEIFPRP